MLILPKILEDSSPLAKQYRDVVLSKSITLKNTQRSNPSKYDWIASELRLGNSIFHQAILKSVISFQLVCKQTSIRPFYSYFFLKSLFMNKNLKPLEKQNLQQSNEPTHQKQSQASNRPLSAQAQTYLVQSIEQQAKNIQAGSSTYHKIESCIYLRQELLDHFLSDSLQGESQNIIHQSANNIRYLNFQIIDLVKSWKNHLFQLQTKTFTGQNLHIDSLSTIQLFFLYQEQNYLSKMIYDNANIINTVNSIKNGKFISPPNPFFLSQDGNKQSISSKEKDRIDQTMEFIAKEKALQLKLMLEQPEYVSKQSKFRGTLRSSSTSRLKVQKSPASYRKEDPFKKLFGSLSKLQLPEKRYHSIKQVNLQNPVKIKNYPPNTSQRGKTQNNNKIVSVYQTRASKLRQQIEKNTETRDKFETMVKKSELEMLRDLKKKKTPPKQLLPKYNVEHKNLQERLKESPYKQRVSSLRREIEKNVIGVKLLKKQIPSRVQKLDESILSFKSQNPFINRPLIQVKTTAPKIKLIQQKQINIDKVPNPTIMVEKIMEGNKNKDKSLSRSKQKEDKKQSYSTFFKTPEEEEMQRSMMRQSRMRTNKISQDPVGQERITNLKRKDSQLNHIATTSNFYTKDKLNGETESVREVQRRTSQPFLLKSKSKDINKQQIERNNIDTSLKHLRQRLRNMEIMKAYGKNSSHPQKREKSEMSLSAIREDEYVQRGIKLSPYKKQRIDKKNRSKFLKKEASLLQTKIQKLLQKQQSNFRFQKDISKIYEQNEDYLSVNRLPQTHTDRLSESESVFDDNLKNLQKKETLIHQSNQMKQKQIQKTAKGKQKIQQQVNQRNQKLRKMEEKIAQIKQKRKLNANQSEEKLKKSILNESKELVAGQKALKVKQLKQTQQEMKKKNQNIRMQMMQEQQKFIKLKEEEFKMKEQLNKKKYLQELQQVKSKYIQKQQQYERKILEEEKLRKQNEIRLMKEKRQAQQLQMKLHEQEMKELLLKEILQKENERWQKQQQQADRYQQQVKKLVSTELKEKEEQEWEINKIYMQENYKLLTLMNEMRQKNFKLEQANRHRLVDVQKAIKEKQQEIMKLQQLERQVQMLEQSRMVAMQQYPSATINHPVTMQKYAPIEEDDLEDLKLRLKEQILKQMIERRKREEQEDLKFQEERKRRLKILQNEIKDFLRKEGEISKVLQYARPEQIKTLSVQNILNREAPHQQQIEIQAKTKTKSIQELRKEMQLTEKQMTTVTTQHQKAYGQKNSQMQQSSYNRQDLYPKSSLGQVLENHSITKPQKVKQNEKQNLSSTPEKKHNSFNPSESNTPSQLSNQIKLSFNEGAQLQKIDEIDRSHSIVLPSKDHMQISNNPQTSKLQQHKNNQIHLERAISRSNAIQSQPTNMQPERQPFRRSLRKFRIKNSEKDNHQSNTQMVNAYEEKSDSKEKIQREIFDTQQNISNQKIQKKQYKTQAMAEKRQIQNVDQSEQDAYQRIVKNNDNNMVEQGKKSKRIQSDQVSPKKQSNHKSNLVQGAQPINQMQDKNNQKSQQTKKKVSQEGNLQQQQIQAQKQRRPQKSNLLQPANIQIQKRFGQLSSIQDKQSKRLGDISKFEQSYETVQRPNDALGESSIVKQKVFKSDEQMLQKFNALKEYLNTQAQFVTIEQAQIESFLDKFYTAHPEEVQEMFSFNKNELLTILKNYKSMDRKIDLFDCHSIGWYDRASNKYLLTGSLGCVHLIAQKYGQIQIEMTYLFDRSNHKQKKFLVKQIKVFEKVGSLFQKKLDEENHYSLKLIIKITKDMIPVECHIPDELVHLSSSVTLLPSGCAKSKASDIQKHKFVFEHVLADCMWQNMNKQQIQQYAKSTSNDSIDLNVFVKSLQSFNEEEACKELKDYITYQEEMTSELDMYFKLPYIQFGKRIHYQIKSDQYQLKNGEKVYLSKHCSQTEDEQPLWKFLVFQTSKTILEDNFIETLLKAKVKQINKLKPERQLNLVLPLFKINEGFSGAQNQGLRQNYQHKSTIDGDLIVSSISCANSTAEQDRKLITLSKKNPDNGFVFCACYCPGDHIEKVVSGAWVGYSDLIK